MESPPNPEGSITSKPAPPVDAVLRRVFWKLVFRGRSSQHASTHQAKRRLGMSMTVLLYGLIGIIPATMALRMDSFLFASILHAYTLMFASLTLASSAGTMLFMKEEAEILLHRPVKPGQLVRAKMAVLVGSSLVMAMALNAVGLITGAWSKGSSWMFFPVHVATTVLLMVFSAACIVMVYNLCLKWLGRDRLDNLLAMLQMVLALAMVLSGQLLPRTFDLHAVSDMGSMSPWILTLPPVWFGALDALAVAGGGPPLLWLAAGLALGSTVLVCWMAFGVLASAYGRGLMTLNESSAAASSKPSKGRKTQALMRLPFFRWWMRDPIEQQAFLLTTAYIFRDREMKLRLLPGLAPMLVMPLVMVLTIRGGTDGNQVGWIQPFAASYTGIIPLQAMLFLRRSEHWRAAGLFHMAPLPHWAPLFHGARKAVLALLTFPMLLLQGVLIAILQGSVYSLAMLLPAMLFLPTFSLVSGLKGAWLPLSVPPEEQRDASMGCLLMAGVTLAAAALGGAAVLCWKMGWFWVFLAGEAVVMGVLFKMLSSWIRSAPWSGHESAGSGGG